MKHIWILLAVVAGLASCYEDKGNYNYRPLNDIEIDMNAEDLSPVLGDTIRLVPVLTFAVDSSERDLSFEWTFEGKTIGNERNLFWIADTTAKGQLVLSVKDEFTNVTYISAVYLTITSAFEKQGWMVLSEKEGRSSLSYLREEWERNEKDERVLKCKVFPDIYNTLNHASLGTEPVKLLEHFCDQWGEENIGRFWVIQRGGEGCIDVSGSTFLKTAVLKDIFLKGNLPEGFVPYDMIDMKWITLAVAENGKIYSRKKETVELFNSGYFLNRPLAYQNREVDGRHLILAPFAEMALTLMYDEPDNRFLAVVDKEEEEAGNVMALVVDEKAYEAMPNFARLDDLGEKKLLFCGPYKPTGSWGDRQGYVGLLKDPQGQLYLYDFQVNAVLWEDRPSAVPVKQEKVDFSAVIDGTAKNVFNVCRYEESAPYLLVSRNNELWIYDRMADRPIRLYHTFSGVITAIDSEQYGNNRIGVGLENGEFYIVDMSRDAVNGLKENLILDRATGLGRIVSVRYKVQNGNDWGF